MRTRVGIIGAGPAGLLLGHLLHAAGIDAVVIERQTRARVLERIRAGVLERTTTDLLHRLGIDERLNTEGLPHDGFALADGDRVIRIDIARLTGRQVTVYGQTEVTRDLIDAADNRGLPITWASPVGRIEGIDSDRPVIVHGDGRRLECDFVGATAFRVSGAPPSPRRRAAISSIPIPLGGSACWPTCHPATMS